MPKNPSTAPHAPLADLLDQRQALSAAHIRLAILELLKFYDPKPRRRYFRRSLFGGTGSSGSEQFNNASILASSAVLNALALLPNMFDGRDRARVEQLCLDALRRYLRPSAVYSAISSDSFGDFNPFTCAFLIKGLLQRPKLCLPSPPLALRLAVRTVLVYLRTSFAYDPSRMAAMFGPRSMWSLADTHPVVVFRCVDALVALRSFFAQLSPTRNWTEQLLGRCSSTDRRNLIASVPAPRRHLARRRFQLIEEEFNRYYTFAPFSAEAVSAQFARAFDDLEQWTLLLLDAETARHRREDTTEFDPSALAALSAVTAIASKGATRGHLAEPMRALFEKLDVSGTWPAGRPFFYDETGGAYHCVSIEIGYIALRAIAAFDGRLPRLAMDRLYDGLHERVNVIYKWIEASQRTIVVTNKQGLFALDTVKSREGRGWANDRSPGIERIDSWMGALVIDFLCTDFALRKDFLRRLILNSYPVILSDDCRPRWNGFVDPDLGYSGSAKKAIGDACVDTTSERKVASILLYGPPGTSKTTLVKALAAERGCDLIQLNAGDFVQDGFELLENRARKIFRDLSRLDNAVVLFDEMDPLIRGRQGRLKDLGTTISDYVIPGMLPKLQDFRDHCVRSNMLFVVATNFRDVVDPAAARAGRIDLECLILPYTRRGRSKQLEEVVKDKGVAINSKWRLAIEKLAEEAGLMVYRDLQRLGEALVEEYRERGSNRNALAAAVRSERVAEALGARTISLVEYRPEMRSNAGYELLCLLHRLLGRRLPRREKLEDLARMRRAFERVGASLAGLAGSQHVFRQARDVARAWASHLAGTGA